jgi:hypothetical protein
MGQDHPRQADAMGIFMLNLLPSTTLITGRMKNVYTMVVLY